MKRLLLWLVGSMVIGFLLVILIGFPAAWLDVWLRDRSFLASQNAIADRLLALPVEESEIVLYSLDPYGRTSMERVTDSDFHGFRVLGQTSISEGREKKHLVTLLAEDMRRGHGSSPTCFNPRHGLRIADRGVTRDFVICFECAEVRPYHFNNDDFIAIRGGAGPEYDAFLDRYGLMKASR